jgi:hypothetical protein
MSIPVYLIRKLEISDYIFMHSYSHLHAHVSFNGAPCSGSHREVLIPTSGQGNRDPEVHI